MSGTWPLWVALVCLVFSHVFMFALGATLYHCLRWINMKPLLQRPHQLDERKLMAIADKAAKAQAQSEQFSWMQRNQQVNGGAGPIEIEDIQEEQKFAGAAKK